MADKDNKNKTKADKSRILVLFLFLIVLIIGIVFAFLGLKKHQEEKQFSGASLKGTPRIESIAGSETASQQYVKTQREENLVKAQAAAERSEKEGKSAAAIPTVTRPVFKGDSSDFLTGTKAGPPRLGCSPEDIKRARAAGVTAAELRCKGCTAKDLRAFFTAAELDDADFSAAELKASGFTATELKEAGFNAKEMLESGFTANELKNTGYTVADMKTAGVTLNDLQKLGIDATELHTAGFTAAQMRAAGFSVDDLKKAGFSAKELKDAGASTQELSDAEFSPTELMEAGATDAELTKAGVLPGQIKTLRSQLAAAKGMLPKDCSIGALTKARTEGVPVTSLADLKCDAAALKAAGYTVAQLKAAGFNADALKAAGFLPSDLKAGGYNAAELKAVALTANELKNAGFSADDLKAAGFGAGELKDVGYTASELKAAGFTPAELRLANHDPAELLKAGITPAELRVAGYTVEQMKAAGMPIADIKKAGFTDGDLIRAGFAADEVHPPQVIQAPTPPPLVPGTTTEASVLGAKTVTALAPVAPSENMTDTEKVIARLQKQQATQLSGEQKNEALKQIEAGMTTQANDLFSSWNPPPLQQYVVHEEPKEKEGAAKGAGGTEAGKAGGAGEKAQAAESGNVVKAGTVMFAVLDTGINSDEVSPILATIVQGSLKGAKLLGQFSRTEKKVLVSFTTMSVPEYPTSFAINAVAIDPDTARTAISSNVDSHYLLRYGSLFASSFLTGYAAAVAQAGGTTVNNPLGGTSVTSPELSPQQEIVVGLGNVGTQYSAEMNKNFSVPPTVTVDSGAGIGILFMADLALPAGVSG